jgi:hypothetical protein
MMDLHPYFSPYSGALFNTPELAPVQIAQRLQRLV